MMVGVSLDLVVYPDMVFRLFINRLITAGLLLLFCLIVRWVNHQKIIHVAVHIIAVLPLASISYMIYETEGAMSPYYAGLNLVLVGATLLLRWATFDSVLNVALCLLIYVVALHMHGSDWRSSFIPSYFIFVTGAIACTGTYFFTRGRFREFCLAKEVELAKEQLEDSNVQLRAMDETKSRFFANISHELRTPLTLILGPTENLRNDKSFGKNLHFLEHLDTIEDNAMRLLRLINDILDLVKLDSDESPLRPEIVDINHFVNGLTNNLKPVAQLKEISMSCEVNTAEQNMAWLDRDRLEKIVLNLAMNAVKFTPQHGTIVLGAETGDNELVITVKDTGQGMSEEDVKNVFVRFWQADMSAKRKHRGAGIGLALVKSLTDSMGGEVTAESVLGKGTTFKVVVPAPVPEGKTLAEVARDEEQDKGHDVIESFNEKARLSGIDSAARSAAALAAESGRLDEVVVAEEDQRLFREGRKRILVADDEDAMRSFIIRQLKGYEIYEARDGAEAWKLAQEKQPDLMILDLMMPELDGIEVASRVRANEQTAPIPIILVTAQASETPRLQALEAGVNDFLAKPFSTIELQVRAKNLLASSEFELKLSESNVQLEEAYDLLKEQETILVQTEKLSSLGRMSAGIVHEVNNPLNYAKTALHALKSFERQLEKEDKEDFIEVLGDAQEGVARVIGIVSDLRAFTRGDAALMVEVALADVVESARRLSSYAMSSVDFKADVSPDFIIEGNEGQLCQLFVNLFQNATRAIQVGGKGDGVVAVTAVEVPGQQIEVTVRDNGCGIEQEDLDKIFDPFFTKNDVGEGMGLGLSICHRILDYHQANIDVRSKPGEYTEFVIRFPKK